MVDKEWTDCWMNELMSGWMDELRDEGNWIRKYVSLNE